MDSTPIDIDASAPGPSDTVAEPPRLGSATTALPEGEEQPERRTTICNPTVEDLFDLAAPAVRPLIARLVATTGTVAGISVIELCVEDYSGEPPLNSPASNAQSGTQQGNRGSPKAPVTTYQLGRGKDIPIPTRFDNTRLSSLHCKLHVDHLTKIVSLEDCSTNGTFVNGARVEKAKRVDLHHGDTVSLLNPALASHIDATSACEYLFQQIQEPTTTATLIDELTCGVCRTVFYRPTSALPCLHTFCAHCLSEWLKKSNKCPECRTTIAEARPSHKIQNVVDTFLRTKPEMKLSAEEMAEFDKLNCIPPMGRKLGRKRHRSDDSGGASDDDEEEEDDSSGNSEASGSSDGRRPFHVMPFDRPPVMMAPARAMPHLLRPAPPQCPQCTVPATRDGFQCTAGATVHLSCFWCKTPYPSRPSCGIPQRCALCNVPYCDLYLEGGCKDPRGVRYLAPIQNHKMDELPLETLFQRNTIEQDILKRHLESLGVSVAACWEECVKGFVDGKWVPDIALPTPAPVTPDTVVCQACCRRRIFEALLFHYRRAIPRERLPPTVAARSDCWYGQQCRTQHHNAAHAQNYNHVCLNIKRKE